MKDFVVPKTSLLLLALLGSTIAGCHSTHRMEPNNGYPCEEIKCRVSTVWAPAFSPGGRQVAFESALDQDGNYSTGIYIHDLTTDVETKVYDDPWFVTSISWSPSKNMMLLGYGYSLSVLDLSTGVRTGLNTLNRDMSDAIWTGEGDSIYYTRGAVAGYNPPDSIGLFVTSPEGGPGRRLVPADGSAVFPGDGVDISPNGKWLTFCQPLGGYYGPPGPGAEIWIMHPDGTSLTQLTNLNGYSHSPRWINGGRDIVFTYQPRECFSLTRPAEHTWVISSGGGAPQPYRLDLGDTRIQFGYPPAIDRTGLWVCVPMLNPNTNYGALYYMDVWGGHARLLHPLKLPPGVIPGGSLGQSPPRGGSRDATSTGSTPVGSTRRGR